MNDPHAVDDVALRAAWMYHDQGYTQAEIASRLGVSRSTISRALQRAEREGIVEIRLTVALTELAKLEAELLAAYPLLHEVAIAPLRDGESRRNATARTTARLIESVFAASTPSVAIGWGRTLAAAAALVRPRNVGSSQVIDAVGHAHSIRGAAATDVSTTLGAAFAVGAVHVPAPALVRDRETARRLRSEEQVRHALDAARRAEVTIVSIGAVTPDTALVAPDLLATEELETLAAAGAVGDILGRFFDSDGVPVTQHGIYWIGLDIEDLRSSHRVVAVAGGTGKVTAIRAAIASGILDAIVTDEATGRELLAHGDTGNAC